MTELYEEKRRAGGWRADVGGRALAGGGEGGYAGACDLLRIGGSEGLPSEGIRGSEDLWGSRSDADYFCLYELRA